MKLNIDRMDHFVITVADRERTAAFYRDVLGMTIKPFGNDRLAIHFGEHKINIHVRGAELAPYAAAPTPGSADVCFITPVPVEEVAQWLSSKGIAVELGPVSCTGATGPLTSVYLRDPDGNLIELANAGKR